jgi:hypothetical protein
MFTPLTAGEPNTSVDLNGGVMSIREVQSITQSEAAFGSVLFEHAHFRMLVLNSKLRKYAEVGYEREYGFSGSTYSYIDSGTAGLRIQYKYKDKSSSWSPFIGVSGQRSTLEYSGIQPMHNFGGTIGLAYHEYKDHLFKITCFRELRRTPVASTTLSYDYEGQKYFGQLKFNATYGNPERNNNTKTYFGGGLRLGTNLSKRFALYGYAEKFDYLDFLIARQVNIGFGLRAAL